MDVQTCEPGVSDQVLNRVVAQEGGEQDRHRWLVGGLERLVRPHAVGLKSGRHRVRQARGQPDDHQVKKIPIDSTCAEFWNVWFMPPPAPRSEAGRLFMTPARFGEANIPIETPLRNSTAANTG